LLPTELLLPAELLLPPELLLQLFDCKKFPPLLLQLPEPDLDSNLDDMLVANDFLETEFYAFEHLTVLATLCLITSWIVLRAWIEAEALVSLLAQTFSEVNFLCILDIDVNVWTHAFVLVIVSTKVDTLVRASTVTEIGTIT